MYLLLHFFCRERTVYLQFSKHQELKQVCVFYTLDMIMCYMSLSSAYILNMNLHFKEIDGILFQQPSGASGGASGSSLSAGASPSASSLSMASVDSSSSNSLHGSVNSVLRVIIENMLYPITIDVLHQVLFLVLFNPSPPNGQIICK